MQKLHKEHLRIAALNRFRWLLMSRLAGTITKSAFRLEVNGLMADIFYADENNLPNLHIRPLLPVQDDAPREIKA